MGVGAFENKKDPLAGGFYTVREAARLLGLESPRKIRGWLSGYPNSGAEPIILRDYDKLSGVYDLSFWDLMEVRFISYFRKQNIPLQTLRKIAVKTRKVLGKQHPFALSKVKFLTDRKKIFSQVVEEMGDRKTLDILGDQYMLYDVIEGTLAKGVEFHPVTSLAESWKPSEGAFPNVLVNPRYAYGHPVISKNHVPTKAIFSLFRAERGDKSKVANWFHVTPEEVEEATEFEIRLAN